MGFTIISQVTEKVEDSNPAVWARAAERSLINGNSARALAEIDKAIVYSNGSDHYLFEKVSILHAVRHYSMCLSMLNSHIDEWYSQADTEKKLLIVEYCNTLGKWLFSNADSLYSQKQYQSCIQSLEQALDNYKPTLNYVKQHKRAMIGLLSKAYFKRRRIFEGILYMLKLPQYAICGVLLLLFVFKGPLKAVGQYIGASANGSVESSNMNTVKRQSQNNVAAPPRIPATQRKPEAKPTPTVRPLGTQDAVLVDLKLGSYLADVKRKMGTPIKVVSGGDGSIYTFSNGVEVTIFNKSNRVEGITIDQKKYVTERGIRVGDSIDKVIAAYGKATESSYENYNLYEYYYTDNPNYILRFAVDKRSQTIDYIGVRTK